MYIHFNIRITKNIYPNPHKFSLFIINEIPLSTYNCYLTKYQLNHNCSYTQFTISSIEFNGWKQMLRIPWTAKCTNVSILYQLNIKTRLTSVYLNNNNYLFAHNEHTCIYWQIILNLIKVAKRVACVPCVPKGKIAQ